ncbi:type III secretion system needle length determinant, SpaN/EivJ family [Yokenella regensburgei]|uniref:SpaN/EivJ family type III secretion system needle length determinant n=1 Tax=Yokenella regensburgei TaxID=158877 RepID=UPI0014333256|nr:hypothetical protein HEC60_25025 [Yokenella regensburgei]
MIYPFTRWGDGHRVVIYQQPDGTLLLHPSDSRVAQQLSEQWLSCDSRNWTLARDDEHGHNHQNREQSQATEEDET